MKQVAGTILVTPQKTIILQHRDNIPTIVSPGMYTIFGGTLEGGEDQLEGAARELHEETNLRFEMSDLVYFNSYDAPDPNEPATTVHVYILNGVETSGLKIFEGQGYVEVSPRDDLDSLPLAPATRLAVTEFLKNYT